MIRNGKAQNANELIVMCCTVTFTGSACYFLVLFPIFNTQKQFAQVELQICKRLVVGKPRSSVCVVSFRRVKTKEHRS